jgi:hypothetical protein
MVPFGDGGCEQLGPGRADVVGVGECLVCCRLYCYKKKKKRKWSIKTLSSALLPLRTLVSALNRLQ